MAVSGTVLTPLIIEYLKLEEYPEGVPLEAKRSLFQIVEYLKTKCKDKELGEISDAKEILKSKMTRAERKERNINDKIRRHLDKSIEITKTGNVRNTRYTYNPQQKNPYYEVFTSIEKLGGVAEEKDIPAFQKEKKYGFREPDEQQRKKDIDEREFPRGFEGRKKYETVKSDLQINASLSDDKGKISLPEIDFPWSRDKEGIYTNHSNYWFEKKSYHWMAKSYFGFQGPTGLNEIIENIAQNIENLPPRDELHNQLRNKLEQTQKKLAELERRYSDIKKHSQFSDDMKQMYLSERESLEKNLENIIQTRTLDEIFMLKKNKKDTNKRHNNRTIITIALLHLNRSLQAQINL